MPPTSIFINAASAGTSGIGNSRISVLLGPVRTAARTFSTTETTLQCCAPTFGRHSKSGHRPVKGDFLMFLGPYSLHMKLGRSAARDAAAGDCRPGFERLG